MKECIDCGAEVKTKSERCNPCRKKRHLKQIAKAKKKQKANAPVRFIRERHCDRCFTVFVVNYEGQELCVDCKSVESLKKNRVYGPNFNHPKDAWISGKFERFIERKTA